MWHNISIVIGYMDMVFPALVEFTSTTNHTHVMVWLLHQSSIVFFKFWFLIFNADNKFSWTFIHCGKLK